MYLKNNKIFLYIFIIATLAYHEQFLSVNVNNEEGKISEEYYFKGCCDCNIFTVNPPFTNKDLIDNFGPNNQIRTFGKMLKIFLGLENKKKIDNEENKQEDSKLLELHKLLNSDFDLQNNENLIKKENLKEDYECKYKKKCTHVNGFGMFEDQDRIIGRFIKINNRIPCLFFQTIVNDKGNLRPKDGTNLIIYFHGLGDSIANYFEIDRYNEDGDYFVKKEREDINTLLWENFDLAIIEYKGGGYYDGDFNEDDFRNNDAKDIFNFFSQLYTNNKIIALGYSLGCAFASQFTAKAEEIINKNNNNGKENTIKTCILIYPFVNIKQAGKHIFETQGGWWGNHFSWLINPILKLRFDNKKWVSNIHSKLLLVNNKNDIMCNEKSIIPLKDAFLGGEKEIIPAGEENYKTYANKGKYIHIMESQSGDHFNIKWEEIKNFLWNLQQLDLYEQMYKNNCIKTTNNKKKYIFV